MSAFVEIVSTFFSSVWGFFEIEYPGTSISVGGLFLGVLVFMSVSRIGLSIFRGGGISEKSQKMS